ncbi:hypothetical protein SmJEL517_g05718 [Synchytrium microbalum]|uniref:Xylulose kinase n=1 Tax=Synchytrium microbalum TaxID=1806994 RepID=A0A507BT55_9FUNG|nr:uncharacterized protein SmJEL517_g05718 [Synchytrium microbalum]TPX30812.1 hypothetical protein SmJEL517_g05718 [Synchytrium microbalum]
MVLVAGIDASTQQLKFIAIDDRLNVVKEVSVNFDKELPHFNTVGGVMANGLVVTAPTLLWVEALDSLLSKLQAEGFPFDQVMAISGSGQQHGSVYWKIRAHQTLKNLDSSKTLHEQLLDSFAVSQSPIWQDASTGKECKMLEDAMGGPQALADLTGSRAYERFTGSQIAKIAHTQPDAYQNTERTSLVSSFMCSLLCGKYAPIDTSDASGMNLMNITTKTWCDELLKVCGDALKEKLGLLAEGDASLGSISSYYVNRYGFPSTCIVTPFTGDNPASLSSFPSKAGDVIISLGTSDTLFLTLNDPKPALDGHILAHPTEKDCYMGMLVYKNGSLARERVRDSVGTRTWEEFDNLVKSLPPGCNGRTGFYYYMAEITPRAMGVFKYENESQVDEFSEIEWNARAILESQALSMASHAQALNLKPERIIATGGGSQNNVFLGILADVFGCEVYKADADANSASLGACYRALRVLKGGDMVVNTKLVLSATPDPVRVDLYKEMLGKWRILEEQVIRDGAF